MSTAVDVAKHLRNTTGTLVSSETIRKTPKTHGLKSGKKVCKPLLSKCHWQLRLQWAKEHRNMTIEDWGKVIFTDETKVNFHCSDGIKWCWKKRGQPFEDRVVSQTMKFGGGKILVWGCFTVHGVGFARLIEGKMNALKYQGILEDQLEQTFSWYDLDKNDSIFMHDNDPKHTAKSTVKFLQNKQIQTMKWPAQSPDMNPIENLWSYVKKQLSLSTSLPKNSHELWERFMTVWSSISEIYCRKLIESMPERINALIKAKGGHTKF